jgi:hypothetical protein
MDGVCKRFGFRPPPHDLSKLAQLREYADGYMRRYLTPLPRGVDVSVESWLARCPYTSSRKLALQKLSDELPPDAWLNKRTWRCKSFSKDEFYPEFKYPRTINSRSDIAKVLVGPIFWQISDAVMHHKYNGYTPFIKYVSIAERPSYIWTHLRPEARKLFAGDYTAFEALFQHAQMQVEIDLYKYMTAAMPEDIRTNFWMFLDDRLAGLNVCNFKRFSTKVEATRMSGEMCTSLGNGWFNLMVLRFLLESLGHTDVQIFVEGDDSIAAYTPTGEPITELHFRELGLVMKVTEPDSINTASFCGIVFHPDDMINVTDPREVLASFGWVSSRYANSKSSKLLALLRAKSLSYLHQYPGCPIIQELALYGLRCTAGYDLRWVLSNASMSQWERMQLEDAVKNFGGGYARVQQAVQPVPSSTRVLVEELFGVTSKQQEQIEEYLRGLPGIQPLQLTIDCSPDWSEYYDRFTLVTMPEPESIWMARYDVEGRPETLVPLISEVAEPLNV